MVQNLMSQLFQRLLGELKRLGAFLVHADFASIVLHTDKEDLQSAREYVSFVLRTVQTKPLFHAIQVLMSMLIPI